MALLNAYALANGHDNIAGLVSLRVIVAGKSLDSHATSMGTFAAEAEFIGLDFISQDMGNDEWEWSFASLTPLDIKTIETDILDGKRSGNVTVETRNRYLEWIQLNAVLTLTQQLPRQGEKFGGVVLSFRDGVILP